MAVSARPISTGPDTVPPGRSCPFPAISSHTVAPRFPTSRTMHFDCGNSAAMNAATSCVVAIRLLIPTHVFRSCDQLIGPDASGDLSKILSCALPFKLIDLFEQRRVNAKGSEFLEQQSQITL